MSLLPLPLPTGLVPVVVALLTVGVSVPVTTAAHRLSRRGRPFAAALRAALLGAAAVGLVGLAACGSSSGRRRGRSRRRFSRRDSSRLS